MRILLLLRWIFWRCKSWDFFVKFLCLSNVSSLQNGLVSRLAFVFLTGALILDDLDPKSSVISVGGSDA